MARSRLEILEEEEAQSQAERARFEELADQYRQQSHLPPGGDQSWRDREAMRRAASDKGHIPPQSDQSQHEREAMQFAPAREDDTVAAEVGRHESQEPVLQPLHVAKGGQGGIVLIFILVAAIALGIAVLAYPELLTASYWRGPQTNSATQPPRAVLPPAAPAIQPAPAEQAPALDLKRAPAEPTPPPAEAPQPPVSVIDATPKQARAPKPASRPRILEREDRGAGGFYAKVPGPDGVMRDTFFPADAEPGPQKPARREPAVPDQGGFYAKVPGPDGTLQDQYFPSRPPPR
jgi:hypothetical protein